MKRRLVLILGAAVPVALLAGAWLWVKAAEWRRWAHLEQRVAELTREADRRRCPRPVLRGTPLPGNAWDDYLPAIDQLHKLGEDAAGTIQMRSHSVDESDLPELRKTLSPLLPAVERLQRGARRSESRRPRLQDRIQPTEELEESWLIGALRLACLASSRARCLALEGKPVEAAELLMDLFKYAEDVAGDGSPVSLRLATTIYDTALEALRWFVARDRITPGECTMIEHDLAQLDATFPRVDPVLLYRLEYFGTWILKGSKTDVLHNVGCIPGNLAFKPGWRQAFSEPLMAVAGFDQTDAWTTRQLSAGEETPDEEEARWKSAFEEWYGAGNIYFRLFTNSEGMPNFRAFRGPRASMRVFRIAVHYRATGEPLDLNLPGFGITVEPKAVTFWGPFAETVSVPR